MSFADLNMSEHLLRAVKEEGYETATPIQAQAIPPILEGRDVLGCAQTGTGKTAAFALPTLHRLAAAPRAKHIRALILAPTRELVSQIGQSFRTYGRYVPIRYTCIFGGVSQGPQALALQRGVDIVIATPGRLVDLMEQRLLRLTQVETLILDEADQMLDMGFIHDLRKIVFQVPDERQTLLFSATMPTEIRRLADEWLTDPVSISVAPQGTAAELVDQAVYFVPKPQKPQVLVRYFREQKAQRMLVFTRTKHGADKLVRSLMQAGVRADAIHGNKTQAARQRALVQFKGQHPPILVATDIASRGLDIDGVSHVVNYDLPMTPEIYVHRIGRTGRAGASGIAITLCDHDEKSMLREIERLTRQKIPVAQMAPSAPGEVPLPPLAIEEGNDAPPRQYGSQGGRPQGNRPQGNRPPRQFGGQGGGSQGYGGQASGGQGSDRQGRGPRRNGPGGGGGGNRGNSGGGGSRGSYGNSGNYGSSRSNAGGTGGFAGNGGNNARPQVRRSEGGPSAAGEARGASASGRPQEGRKPYRGRVTSR